ncbi:hypothetical protein FQN57_002158 [Myotisia sp. PD_48]|nr:hypothetical protein FQN57_002158 [Myotisia sp. PD_48]
MGRIEKVTGPKHEATISPAVAQFTQKALSISLVELPSYLATFPRRWPFPRGDLYHWIGLLNRFDEILERIITKYELDQGPQTKSFGCFVLVEESSLTNVGQSKEHSENLVSSGGFGREGDRELVESILNFSRLLLEKCGNRSLYSSSERLNAILNTTSLTLIQCTLRLSLCLAQRYFFRQKSSSSTHFHQSLLATHYNIEMERVQKLAAPFPRPASFIEPSEKGHSTDGEEKDNKASTPHVDKCNANDLISLTKETLDKITLADISPATDTGTATWEEWGNVRISYYPRDAKRESSDIGCVDQPMPITPTPSRTRNLDHPSSRLSYTSNVDDSPASVTQSPAPKQVEPSHGMRVLEISSSKVLSSSIEDLLLEYSNDIPQDTAYELLNRLRIAAGLATSSETRDQVIAIRLLAVTNLAYVYPEAIFQQKILHSDSDEPKRLQLAYQLAEFVHLGIAGDISASQLNQSFAISCLDALAKHKSRAADVCTALNLNVNHGILMFIMRKTVADLAVENDPSQDIDGDDWRDALFSLLRTLPSVGTRTPETMVSAGLIPMFVDMLNLRTEKARRIYPRVLEFLDNFVHSVRDALTTLATAKGFDAISDLISFETTSAFDLVNEGKGISSDYKTPSTDYEIPYFHQQAMRWLFKFVNHVMQHNSGGFERLLRNLIDSPPLLSALRLVIENSKIFGSHVWSGAVNIMSHFIHNEPTSYAVIAEAGLSTSFLEAVMCQPIHQPGEDEEEADTADKKLIPFNDVSSSHQEVFASLLSKAPENKSFNGILPSTEAILCIPLAFGAICLHSTGLKLFQASDALERFFDIFDSPDHVKCMKHDSNLLRLLGNSFDELVRHHPALKASVMNCVLRMVARAGALAKYKAWECGLGTKLWTKADDGKLVVSGGPSSLLLDIGAPFAENIEACQTSSPPGRYNGNGDLGTYQALFGDPKVDTWRALEVDQHDLTVSQYIFPVLKFLGAFFENQSICSTFIENGGVEYVLDFATLQTLPYRFRSSPVTHQLAQVVHSMAETKPHLVLPSLLNRSVDALDRLEQFWGKSRTQGFFAALTTTSENAQFEPEALEVKSMGTYFAKHLVAVGTLIDILREIYTPPIYPTRSTQTPTPFILANLSDRYIELIKRLGRLHSVCVWEEILLQKDMPESWKDVTASLGTSIDADRASDGRATPTLVNPDTVSETGDVPADAPAINATRGSQNSSTSHLRPASTAPNAEQGPELKNLKTLRYLLSTIPSSITGFLNVLGHGLVNKRRTDSYQRQKAITVADAIATTMVEELNFDAAQHSCTKDRFSYLIVILSSLSQLIFDSTAERPHSHCLTLILNAFKQQNGLQIMKQLANRFLSEIAELAPQTKEPTQQDIPTRLASAYGGIKIILTFFSEMVSSRYIIDSTQTQAMVSINRERERPEYFHPSQFLIELRAEALPLVEEMWTSEFVETASRSIVKALIEILRATFEADYEIGAIRRSHIPNIPPVTPKVFSVHRERLNNLVEKGYDETLAREALYRCNNSASTAEEYCEAQKGLRAPPRNPIPQADADASGSRSSATSRAEPLFGPIVSQQLGGSPAQDPSQPLDDAITTLLGGIQASQSDALAHRTSDTPTDPEATISNSTSERQSLGGISSEHTTGATPSQPTKKTDPVTIEDLESEREKFRSNLIERCLEILSAHNDVTFELADLINAAAKFDNHSTFRREIGETLLHFLASLQMEENFESGGKNIAAHANLLALLLQERLFYNATLDSLQDNFNALLGFIKIPSDKATQEGCPWIGQVLLILENVLSDDASPRRIAWNPPNVDISDESDGGADLDEPLISIESKSDLFDAILDILPRIARDESLALSVTRILVILSRERKIASRLGEKRNLQRLFVMIKQLANASSEKLLSSFMLVLRHVVEDDDTIRQIMRSEILANFESRPSRQVDSTNYVRQFSHLVLRAPQLFVDVTNELVKIQKYDSSPRAQFLVLKTPRNNGQSSDERGSENSKVSETQDLEVSADKIETERQERHKELRIPVVEHPDGVIHYLLSELFSYRDVDDKEITVLSDKPVTQDTDIEMTTEDTPSAPANPSNDIAIKKEPKPQFKVEEHPIYIYRCFLLQCLTELLSSYNRTKVEFINFSRKADPLATTPSKPRSNTLNYLFHSLIPVGTLEHDESLAFKKRLNTSNWAMKVVVALCSRTSELGGPIKRFAVDEETEPDLLFVRKFTLEHALKAYKDISSSQESLDIRYSRLMCMADLFDKMLSGGPGPDGLPRSPNSTRQIVRMMFEKNFISAFTAAIADIDLNFPSSKRVVKYILRPLTKLTQTAVLLSDDSSISSAPRQTDEDEISSATSVSDIEDDREETPDLFRHSTLGMFEPHNEEETSSGEDEQDEEMYDAEYDEDMEYEEDIPEHDGEVVSDEDEDIGGGGSIEGLPADAPYGIEVLIESEGSSHDEESEDDGDDEDSEEDDDDDEDLLDPRIVSGEITGDNDNDSLHGGEEGEWESEDDSGDDEDEEAIMSQLENDLEDIAQGDHRSVQPHLDSLLRVLEGTGASVEGIDHDGDDFIEDDMNEEDDDEDVDELEDELDDFDDEHDIYRGYRNDDDADASNSPWGWDEPILTQNRLPSRNIPSWNFFPGHVSNRGILPMAPGYRSHRTQIAPTRNDDGANPLLRRVEQVPEQPAQGRAPNTEAFSDWVHAVDPSSQGRLLSVDSPVSFMNAIMQVIGQGGPDFGIISRPDGIHVHIDQGGVLPGRLQDLFGLGRAHVVSSRSRDDPGQAVAFSTSGTINRWQEEGRLLFNNFFIETAQRIVKSILKVLVPPAVAEEQKRQEEIEERKRLESEKAEQEKQEQIAREATQNELKHKEAEERAAEERARQAADTEPMEDVQPNESSEEPVRTTEVQPVTEPTERVHTTIRGRQLDITDMQIDPEYLEALPEEIREEVIMQQLAEQRSHAAAAGEEPSEINPEFLEALPPEIREELLQQEAADRRRREREATRRQAAANGTPHAEDMDPASFIATLDPSLRETVLADQPDEILASLGPEFVTEARALTGRRLPRFGDPDALESQSRQRPEQTTKKTQRRQAVQMLDKAGVATLLRLMFMPLQGNSRHHLNDILHNVCKNRQNRSEVISLLLLILQDGSADISAVERSFAHLSLRARTPAQKTPQGVKRTVSLPLLSANSDVTPIIVIQQCLGTLSFLTQYDPHIAWFFLTEHETTSALKMKSLRKGKGKESRANKFALNSLLSLLERKAILDSPNCMEQLSSLLSSITQPLTLLLKKEKEKQEDKATANAKDKADSTSSGVRDERSSPPADGTNTQDESTPQQDVAMADSSVPHPLHAAEATQPGTSSSPGKETAMAADEEKQRKPRVLEPPVIPEHNLRLVVHILSARECNGKTFRETLSTINNLCSVPGAKEMIGKELVSQAQTLSKSILIDLNDLIPHVSKAHSGTDVQGIALAKFSPAGSDQAKLLRVLTALDYLFDPSRAEKEKLTDAQSFEKADTLKSLYENITFGPLWMKLSDSLTAIQLKDNMLNVATTLLPLIESLMVVCKNTTLKDVLQFPRHGREFSVSSPPPDSGMQGLFFNFTESHRKILNELVRQNPRLMSGTFSLLVKNPKVLEFDNKRNYFNRRIHSRGTETRHPHPPLQLSVRRDQVFLDSFKSLYFKSADEMKYGKLGVRFHGEEGVDAGGVTREWFQVLARGMFNPDYALFIPVASDRTTFHPNRLSGVNQEHLMFFKFIGRIIGKALYEGRVLDCHFSRAVYKRILGKSVSIKDMETLDLDYYKSLLWMLENDITDILTENFSVEVEDFGETRVIDLIDNGRNIPVTQENKEEYVQLVVEHRLTGSVKEQLDHFLKGFHDIIPADLISIFNEQELELLISGLPEIDVDDWKNNAEYHNYSASSPQIQWFWRAVRSFDKEERAKLLQFVSGTSKVPLNGFRELEGMNGFSKFNIHRDYGNKERLPSSHTCFNQLDLPEYESYEMLRKCLYTAITAGSEYFGFA